MLRLGFIAGIGIGLLCGGVTAIPLQGQTTGAIVPVTLSNTLAANDDGSTDAVPLNIGGSNGINFFGQTFTQVYVNNNGNLTFSEPLGQFTPNGLAQGVGLPVIAPFFADVDTTGMGSGLVQYGNAAVNGFNAFVANYINVGYFASETDKLNSFQVILIDRSDVGAGDFDIEFNYDQIVWETGDASGGTDGLGGTSAAVGYSNGLTGSDNIYFQLPGSLINGALIDGGPDALISHSLNSGVAGRYIFPVRKGAVTVLVSSLACVPGILSEGGAGTCTITLTGNAPAGGSAVSLSSSNSALSVPASVTIPAGQNSVTFAATASTGSTGNQSAIVTATYGGNSQTASITVTSAVQTGYIGVFYNSTPPVPCPASLSMLCAANNTVNNNLGGGPQDGPVFVFVNTSSTPITNAVLTIVGVDFFDVGTIAANSSVTVIPGVSDDGQNHGSNNFFTVTGGVYDSSDNFASLNSTQFTFTVQQGSTQIVSVDICGFLTAPIFTPACTTGPSNDGTVPNINFLGGPGDNDGPCDNCFGPAIIADLDTITGLPTSSSLQIPGGGGAAQVTLPGGTVSIPYSQTLQASNGNPPYSWSLIGGVLPSGLSLNSSGTLSGTPSKAGGALFTARVTDASGGSASSTFFITIAPQALTVTTVSPLPNGILGSDYPAQIMTASGGNPPYTFQITSGALPGGLTFSNGEISGIPTAAGAFTLTVTVTDSSSVTASAQFQLTIQGAQTSLILSQASVAFSLNTGATGLPAGANVPVRSSAASQQLTYSISVSPTVTWLDVTGGGTTPGTISIRLDPKALSLGVGTNQTSIVVTCGSPGLAANPCSGNSQTIRVSLTVASPPPQLSITNGVLLFTSQTSNPQPVSQTLGLQNLGGGTITLNSVTAANTFVTITGAPGTISAGPGSFVTVTVNPTGLAAGFYESSVLVSTSAGSTSIPVTLLITQNPPMTLSPAGVLFQASAGALPGNPQGSFQVTAAGGSTFNWTASLLPGANWLTLNTTSGTSTSAVPGTVNFSVNSTAASLAPQAYYAQIQVTSSGVDNSPQSFVVVLNVAPATTPVLPVLEPEGLLFIDGGTSAPPAQTVQVFASSGPPVTYQASSDSPWLLVSPASGSATAASPGSSSVSVNVSGLASGAYRGNVSYALASAVVQTVNVTLIVNAGASTSADRPRVTCTPTQLVPTQTGLVNNFAQPTAWPTPLAVLLVNDCGQPVNSAQVVAIFSNGDPPLALNATNTTSGIYSGTWTPRNAAGQVTIAARATSSTFPAATVQITGQVTPNAAPLLNLNGTLNAFAIGPEPGAPVAPGTIVQIYGSNLASQATSASTVPLPTNLNQTSVLIGGRLAPLYYVSPGQINAMMPFELQAGSQYQIIVSANGALSTPNPIQLTPDAPGIAQFYAGQVIATHPDGITLITETSPAAPGEVIVIYLAGMGLTSQTVVSGNASPYPALALDTPTLKLNGIPVTNITFAGLTPTAVALYQIDFQVPASAPNGDLQLVVTQTSGLSNSAIVPVHN